MWLLSGAKSRLQRTSYLGASQQLRVRDENLQDSVANAVQCRPLELARHPGHYIGGGSDVGSTDTERALDVVNGLNIDCDGKLRAELDTIANKLQTNFNRL